MPAMLERSLLPPRLSGTMWSAWTLGVTWQTWQRGSSLSTLSRMAVLRWPSLLPWPHRVGRT